MIKRPALFWIDVGVKAALIGLLLFGVLAPDLPQFEGKAWLGRALAYPISALIVPVGWWLVCRRRGRRSTQPAWAWRPSTSTARTRRISRRPTPSSRS